MSARQILPPIGALSGHARPSLRIVSEGVQIGSPLIRHRLVVDTGLGYRPLSWAAYPRAVRIGGRLQVTSVSVPDAL